MEKAEVLTGAAIVARPQAAHRVEPGEVALDYPAVAAEAFLRLDAPTSDARGDAPFATGIAALPEVVPFVRMHLRRPTLWAARSALLEGGMASSIVSKS